MLERVSVKPGQEVKMPSGRPAVVSELTRFGVSFTYLDSEGEQVTLARRAVRQMFP